MRFRKLAVTVEAARWRVNGDHPDDGPADREGRVVRYFRRPDVPGARECEECGHVMNRHGWIDQPGGGHTVCPGDWIVTGVTGERYPVKPEMLAATYVPIDEDAGLRRFVLVRDLDVSGISGEGVVVWGVCFPDGTCAYRWNSRWRTTTVADCMEDVESIHGHNGATRVVWLDDEAAGQAWLECRDEPDGVGDGRTAA